MNSQQVQDIRLMYEAVYNEELREKAEEYNNTVYDEDIVEVATEYFYTYGLNSDGVDILIEKVGLDNFVEFVYGLSEDLVVLTEARSARRRSGGPSYDEVKAKIDAKEAAKKKAKKSAQERTETERKEPESKGPDTEAKAEQPKSKKPIRDAIARQILAGMERHRKATQTAGRLASETGKTLGKAASVAHEAGRRAGEHVKKHGLKSLANEEYIDEAGMDMFSTPAYKKSKADAAAKFYTQPVKPLPPYGNAPRGASGPHAADAAVGTQTLIKPYNARSVVPRFPGLTLPEPDNSVPRVNIPKFPSPKTRDDGRTEKPKRTPRETPIVTPPVAQKQKPPKVTTPPVVSQKPQLPKTPNPLMVDMPKGPGSMAPPEKPSVPASTGPRTPISPGSFGGGVGTKPTGMSGGTSTVRGLDRSVTSGLTTKPQDEAQKKAREKSALSQRVAGYRSGGPSAGVREEFDLFDYLLEYLVAEGYADTNQDALVLMANMSQEDLDEATRFFYKLQAKGKRGSKTAQAQLRSDADLETQKNRKIRQQQTRQRQEREPEEDERDHGSMSAAERNPSMR